LRTDASDSLLSEGGATARDHFFSASGGGEALAVSDTIDGWESESRISDSLLLEGGRAHFFSDSGGGAARIVLVFSAGVSVNVCNCCWGGDQTLGDRSVSGLGVHLYGYGGVFGTLGCKVVGNDSC
jgi:hypothetical protein